MRRQMIFRIIPFFIGLCLVSIFSTPASAGVAVIVKGSTLTKGGLDPIVSLPEGRVLDSVSLTKGFWNLGFARDDLLIHDLSTGVFIRFNQSPLALLSSLLDHPERYNLLVYDPAFRKLLTYNDYVEKVGLPSPTVRGILDRRGTILILQSDLAFTGSLAGNTPPVASCQNVTVDAGPTCTATASVDKGSYDPDGDPITLTQSPAGPYSLGDTLVTLTVSDNRGGSSQCTGTVTVLDKTPPAITSVSANPSVLWPPNHKMVNVIVNYEAADNCGQPTCGISLTSNEPIITADYAIADEHHVQLVADRLGSGNGRIYSIAITCEDASDNSSSEVATVTVPHDQKNK
jgi:hypothetical protein